MILYPAIDLLDGACVRLRQGDFEKRTIYGADPIATAQGFVEAGAEWLHLVDLSGAKNAANRQTTLIAQIAKQIPIPIQTGGGIRSADDLAALLDAGAARVVIGSMAVQQTAATKEILRAYGPDRITLALDVREVGGAYAIAIAGWQTQSTKTLGDILASYLEDGLRHVLCTDITRDGMLAGPNTTLYQSLCSQHPALQIQASGGVSSLADLSALQAVGAAGAVIGKALYEGRFGLVEALAC